MEQREDLEINLGFLVREVVRKAWIIVLATIVCAAGMFCFSNFVKDPVYESSVKVYETIYRTKMTAEAFQTLKFRVPAILLTHISAF